MSRSIKVAILLNRSKNSIKVTFDQENFNTIYGHNLKPAAKNTKNSDNKQIKNF